MIDVNEIFDKEDKRIALWCDGIDDGIDLATMAENIIIGGFDLISVVPNIVPDIWVYLEKNPVRIFARYNFNSGYKNIDNDVMQLARDIKSVFRHGANGVQLFLKMNGLDTFVEKLLPVRADLFFEKDLCVCMDIGDIDVHNWGFIFERLRKINASAFGLTLHEDMGNRSDFVGRVYGMLENWDFDGDLHFMLNNNYDRIDQVVRLIQLQRPELKDRVKFFLEY